MEKVPEFIYSLWTLEAWWEGWVSPSGQLRGRGPSRESSVKSKYIPGHVLQLPNSPSFSSLMRTQDPVVGLKVKIPAHEWGLGGGWESAFLPDIPTGC